MELADKVRTLQAIYAGALADTVLRLGNEGVLEKVTLQKRNEQMMFGKARAAQFGMTSARDVFEKLSDLMGCADWSVSPDENGTLRATATRCMLCAYAKKLGAASPCRIYCLDPMEGMVKGLDERTDFVVMSTLYDGGQCVVRLSDKED